MSRIDLLCVTGHDRINQKQRVTTYLSTRTTEVFALFKEQSVFTFSERDYVPLQKRVKRVHWLTEVSVT